MSVATARNIVIVLVLAALVVVLPGGGTGATVVLQAAWLLFLATFGWFAMVAYRQHRTSLYSLGDRRRALLYGATAVAVVMLTGRVKMWETNIGEVIWVVLMGAAIYAAVAVLWSARRY